MKLFNSIGPNPHVVRMFIFELGIEVPIVEVDLMGGENRQAEHLKGIHRASVQLCSLTMEII